MTDRKLKRDGSPSALLRLLSVGEDFMKCVCPRYGLYLLWWCGVWLLTTVPTQMPELYERSLVNGPWEHISVFSEMMGDAGGRLLLEIPFGLMWGSLSWLLQWGISSKQSRSPMTAVVLVALVEAALLGLPLAYINTGLVNFSLGTEDRPAAIITNRSILIESTGILLAFTLACFVAGYCTVDWRKRGADDVAHPDPVWPPPNASR